MPSKSPTSGSSLGPLHYLLIFSAFGLLALTVISRKYQDRQTDFEQQFSGIREIQQREQADRLAREGGGAATDPRFARPSPQTRSPDGRQPLIITLRPLMLLAAVVMLCAWAILQWRRLQRGAAPPDAHDQPTPRPQHEQPSP
jgi:cytochrome c-type biogenesis protein CcmH/NrfG